MLDICLRVGNFGKYLRKAINIPDEKSASAKFANTP
jgi:hypothetical protein